MSTRYILRRDSDHRVLCRPLTPGAEVAWEVQETADKWGITLEFVTQKGADNALKNYGPKGITVVMQELVHELENPVDSVDLPTIDVQERIVEQFPASDQPENVREFLFEAPYGLDSEDELLG